MKKWISPGLALLLLLSLFTACQSGEEGASSAPAAEASVSARECAEAALLCAGEEIPDGLERLNKGTDEARLSTYIEAVCGLTREDWADAAVIRATGASAFEILVLCLGDEDAAAGLEPILADYLSAREGAFTGYAPAQAEMAAGGSVRREGAAVGLLICPDPERAGEAFAAACRGEAPPPPPEPETEEEDFTPLFTLRDLFYRLLLKAACPEWADLEEKGWSTSNSNQTIQGSWIPEDGGAWTMGGIYQDEDTGELWAGIEHEVIINLCENEEAASGTAENYRLYLAAQEAWYDQHGYEDKAELLKSGQAVSAGRYAALIVSEHAEDAALLFPRIVSDPDTAGYFDRCIHQGQPPAAPEDPDPDYPDRTRFVPPNQEDMSLYDTSAILAAWEAGDPSGLTGDDREIYDSAEEILAEIIQDGMTGLEKETAVYCWLVDNVDYDWSRQDALAETSRRSYGPYGGLVSREATCLGYASSFQLLMDLCGVECITVVGACLNNAEDHAWNMVRLNGNWYCVDVTWDTDGRVLGDLYEWQYLNITSDEMAQLHQWDYANTPEATATDRGQSAEG